MDEVKKQPTNEIKKEYNGNFEAKSAPNRKAPPPPSED